MSYRVIQWATGGVGRAAIEGVLAHPDLELVGPGSTAPPRPASTSAPWSAGPHRGDRHRRRRRPAGHRRRLCRLQPVHGRPQRGDRHPRVGQERGHPAGLVLPAHRRAAAVRRGGQRRRRHPARHRHPPGGHHRAVPADDLRAVGLDHPRAGRGVLRHPHLRRPRRGARLDALRQDARGGSGQHHARRAGRRLPPVDLHGGRRARLRPRSRAAHHPRDGGRHRAHRLADRPHPTGHGGGPTLHLGGHWSTASRWSPRGELAHGRGRTSTPPGPSVPRASASRSSSPATPAAWPPSRSCTRSRSRRAWRATRASWPPPCTASTPSPMCATPTGVADLPRPAPGGRAGRARPPPVSN